MDDPAGVGPETSDRSLRASNEPGSGSTKFESEVLPAIDALNKDYSPGERESTNVEDRRMTSEQGRQYLLELERIIRDSENSFVNARESFRQRLETEGRDNVPSSAYIEALDNAKEWRNLQDIFDGVLNRFSDTLTDAEFKRLSNLNKRLKYKIPE